MGGSLRMSALLLASLYYLLACGNCWYGTKKEGHINDNEDVSAEGDAVNHPGIDGTSKACRYDDGPGWSDCDPFELIRYKVLKLVHGGSQCESQKNITKHCTPHDFPFGTHWLIQEHRKCIAELNRLKAMIADLHKFIETLHTKGKELFAAYQKLKVKLDELQATLEKMKHDGEHSQEVLKQLQEEMEEWRSKARDLQVELDEVKAKYHDLEQEEKEITMKNGQLNTEINQIKKENEGMEKKIEKTSTENDELRKRILEYEHIKEKVEQRREERTKLERKLDRLNDYLEKLKDDLAEQRINNLKNSFPDEDKEIEAKDTHVDLNMEMFIVHNKTTLYKPTYKPVYYNYSKPYTAYPESQAKCLISYYGVTNETCWYESEGERSEDNYVDALGHHEVEAHWKYFTIDVADQAECDKAAHLHYEFLINRCSPKHYLPVMSVFRPDVKSKTLGTHFYPKMEVKQGTFSCWITFLGAHGHCEAHSSKYDLYNSDDSPEGYSQGSGASAEACLARAEWWMKYCDTPVLATYVPDGVSSNWNNDWIMHDSHGGKMFEELEDTLNQINPDSMNPHQANPSGYHSIYKSQPEKSPDYHDSPEYRKSLHLEGEEKDVVLEKLRKRLGGSGGQVSSDVLHHEGVDTGSNAESAYAYKEKEEEKYEATKYEEPKEEPKYEQPKEEPKYETPKYEEPASEAPKYEEPKYESPKEEPKYEPPKEEPKYEQPKEEPKYEQPREEPKYETPKYEEPSSEAPKYEEPKYEGSEAKADNGPKHVPHESAEEPDSFKDTII